MTPTLAALALVVASSLFWSLFDLLRKLLVQRIRPLPLLVLQAIGQGLLFLLWAAWDPPATVSPAYLLPAAGSVVFNIGANIAFVQAVRISPLSMTIPLLSLLPAFTTLAAVPLLGELPSPIQAAGVLLVVVGALRLSTGGRRRREGASLLAAATHDRGALLMVVVALLWALSVPLDKLAIQAANPAFHAAVLSLGVAVGALGILGLRGELGELRTAVRAPWLLALSVPVSALALGLQLVALAWLWVGLVETLKRSIGNIMALVFGRFLLHEAITWVHVTAVLLMAAGVALILT